MRHTYRLYHPQVCETLYGHYLLPSGKLAHFYLGDTVRKGHRVNLVPPPDAPFEARHWFRDGLPASDVVSAPERHLQRSPEMVTPLWCPVPELGPAVPPGEHVLDWAPGMEGRQLAMRTLALYAQVCARAHLRD